MKNKLLLLGANIVIILASISKIHAQNTTENFVPQFKNLNYEENYTALQDSTLRDNLYKKIKYIPLYKNGYLTIGGEVRLRMEIRDHLNYGNPPEDRGPDFQQRTRLWADYHFAKNFRFFAELQSGTSYGLEAKPSPLDKNQLEFHQLFFDTYQKIGDHNSLQVRLGRQEITIGKARLFDTRTPPNTKHAQDAARIIYTTPTWLWEAFGGMDVTDKIGTFNDGWNKNFTFFATHFVKKDPFKIKGANAEFLYAATNRSAVPTNAFFGSRSAFSARFSGIKGGLNYDVEGIYQVGNGINNQNVQAWFIGSETNYTFASKLKPYIGYKLDIGSGDRNANDNKNNSYDFLWSKGISFGSDLGYTNLMSFGPAAGLQITPKIKVDLWAQWLWRNSLEDGLYKMSEAYQRVPSYGTARYVGFRNLLKAEYQVNPYLLLGMYFNRTYKGTYLKENDHNKDLFYGIFYATVRF